MRIFRSQLLLILLAISSSWPFSPAWSWQPPRGSPVRDEIFAVLRPLVERDLGSPVMFSTNAINVEGSWAYVSARPTRGGGKEIDWARTRFAHEYAGGMMSDSILVLLRNDGSGWRIVEYALGPTDVAWVDWIAKHKVPRGVFENATPSTGQGAVPSAPRPQAQATPLPKPAAPAPVDVGWRSWPLGDLTFQTPQQWHSLDTALAALKLGGPPWNATFSDQPMNSGRGAMLVFSWSDDEFIYSRGLDDGQILGKGPQQFDGIAGTRFFFQIRDRYNDFRGFDVVSTAPLKGGTFSMGCRAPSAQWPRMAETCERILGSIRIASAVTPQPNVATRPGQAAPMAAMPPKADPANAAFAQFTTALEKLEAFEKSTSPADWKAGLAAAQSAVELQPQAADYWRILGYAYGLGGQQVELASALAEEAYEKSIALDPNNTGSRMLLAALLLQREAYSRALDHIEAALRVKADLATSTVVADMCRIYILDEQTKRGAAYFETFVAGHPRIHAARLGLAILLKEQNRAAEALQHATNVANDPQAPQTDAEHAKALLKAWQ